MAAQAVVKHEEPVRRGAELYNAGVLVCVCRLSAHPDAQEVVRRKTVACSCHDPGTVGHSACENEL